MSLNCRNLNQMEISCVASDSRNFWELHPKSKNTVSYKSSHWRRHGTTPQVQQVTNLSRVLESGW